jgi:hypothetical protein
VVVRQGDASHSERYRRDGAGDEGGQRPGGGRWACLTTTSVTVRDYVRYKRSLTIGHAHDRGAYYYYYW